MKLKKMAKSDNNFSNKLRNFNRKVHDGSLMTYIIQCDDFIRSVRKSDGHNEIILDSVVNREDGKIMVLCNDKNGFYVRYDK